MSGRAAASALVLSLAAALGLACGSTTTIREQAPSGDDAGEATGDDAGTTSGGDASSRTDAGGTGGGDAGAGVDAGWNGTFSGPLTCSTPGSFATNWSNQCGTERWTIKTGADSAAKTISLLPQLTTIATLGNLPTQTFFPATTRIKPVETTVYALKDVRLAYVRLEDDSDYHIVLASSVGQTMITEIPYPGGCTTNSDWQCLLSRARANVDAHVTPKLLQGQTENLTVSVVGVGFYDPEHGQYGALPNGLELHPLLAICFGAGCDPTQ